MGLWERAAAQLGAAARRGLLTNHGNSSMASISARQEVLRGWRSLNTKGPSIPPESLTPSLVPAAQVFRTSCLSRMLRLVEHEPF